MSMECKAPAQICITIAKKRRDCNGGVGFRCGVFECPLTIPPIPVPSTSRVQPAVATYQNGVFLIFVGPPDGELESFKQISGRLFMGLPLFNCLKWERKPFLLSYACLFM